MSKEKPEVGDVWEAESGALLHVVSVDERNNQCGVIVSDNNEVWDIDMWWFNDAYKYLGKSKVSIKELFDVEVRG